MPLARDETIEAVLAKLSADPATQTTLAAILTSVDGLEAAFATLSAKDFATQTTLASLLTELALKADLSETQPVSAASLPLPSGAATDTGLAAILTELAQKLEPGDLSGLATAAKQDTLAAKDFATQTTLAAILAKLIAAPATEATLAAILADSQAKADLSETQPVSAAALPLPSGAATSAKQDTSQTRLDLLATDAKLELVRLLLAGTLTAALDATTLAALETTELGATTLAALESITIGTALPAGTNNIGDVDVLTEPATAADNAASLPAVVKVMAGWDGTNVQALSTDSSGNLQVEFGSAQSVTISGGIETAPSTSGGLTPHKHISTASTNATSLKASAGHLYGGLAYNLNATVRYLKIYNKASAPTVGTDTPVLTIPIPPTSGVLIPGERHGVAFATGIAYAMTTGYADNDTGAVGAGDCIINLLYK